MEWEDMGTTTSSAIMPNMPNSCLVGIHFAFGPYAVPVSFVYGMYKIEIVSAPEMNLKEMHEMVVVVCVI
jgi:nitroimidazol reductase NimA-like FMN-containing flavoprotein (pyridoxamine 5'-phosphate oxidase superfamily)